jgi:uncharacterized protein
MNEQNTNASNKQLRIALDHRLLYIILMAVIATMLIIWKPWSPSIQDENRVITVSGSATIKAEPDEYSFGPSYQFKNTDKAKAREGISKKSDEVIKKLKELGVPDSQIKSNSSGYDFYHYYYDSTSKTNNYTLQLTVVVDNRDLAQKIQDYLITTEPTGRISPTASFSEAKLKELESQARDEATKEARAKADQSAQNLGFKVGKVKSVNDGAGFGNGYKPETSRLFDLSEDSVGRQSLSVQPGENDLSYSVTVVYYLR